MRPVPDLGGGCDAVPLGADAGVAGQRDRPVVLGFGSTSSATTSSGDSVPNSRARGFRPAAVPNPATGCAVAGLSLDPATPAGSSSSTTSGGASRYLSAAQLLALQRLLTGLRGHEPPPTRIVDRRRIRHQRQVRIRATGPRTRSFFFATCAPVGRASRAAAAQSPSKVTAAGVTTMAASRPPPANRAMDLRIRLPLGSCRPPSRSASGPGSSSSMTPRRLASGPALRCGSDRTYTLLTFERKGPIGTFGRFIPYPRVPLFLVYVIVWSRWAASSPCQGWVREASLAAGLPLRAGADRCRPGQLSLPRRTCRRPVQGAIG